MSRIGKNPIKIPEGVVVEIKDGIVKATGPLGTLERSFLDDIKIEQKDGNVICSLNNKTRQAVLVWGTYASHIRNMIVGVSQGYEKKLQIDGVGYKVKQEAGKLVLNLGFSHSIDVSELPGIKFTVEKNTIVVSGTDKELVGQVAANIRALKKPEPYKGKGIHYEGEVIRRKVGKKAATAA